MSNDINSDVIYVIKAPWGSYFTLSQIGIGNAPVLASRRIAFIDGKIVDVTDGEDI